MDISKIKVGSTSYDIKDASARSSITSLQNAVNSLEGGQYFLGVTTTAITDGDTTATVSINGENKTAVNGNIVIYGNKEFIFDGANWYEFGDLSTIGDLGYKDSASASYTPAGSNTASAVSFSGTADADFVTGVASAAVAPSLGAGFYTAGVAPSFTEGAFSAGTLPSFTEGEFSAGTLPSLGAASTGSFNTDAYKAAYISTGNDAETLELTPATTASAVTAQGTFSAGTLPSKGADTFSAGTLPSKANDTFSAGSATVIDTTKFNAGSAATFNTAKAITAIGTATAAAQTFTGSAATITVA